MTRTSPAIEALRRLTGTDDVPAGDADLTEGRRGSRRNRRAVTSTVAAIGARGVALLVSLISVPLLIGFLGVERYGILVAATSLTSMLVFADFGLANGLLNLVSEANGRDDREAARRGVSSAFVMLTSIAVILGVLFLALLPAIPLADLFNVTDQAAQSEVTATVAVLVAAFFVSLPFALGDRVRLAFQESFVTSFFGMAAAGVSLGTLLWAIGAGASLPVVALALSVPYVIAVALNNLLLFVRDRPWLSPRPRLASRDTIRRLAQLGFLFVVLQLAYAVAFQSDVLVAATVIGPDAAATYSVTLKVFLVVPTLISIYFSTLWPAYTEAMARGDGPWVRQTLRRSVLVALAAAGAVSLVLLLLGPWLIGLWTGGAIDPPLGLIVGAAVWAVLSSSLNAIAVLFNAASVVAFQVINASVMAAASIGMSVLFGFWFGVEGIIWGTVVAYTIFGAIPLLLYLPRVLRRLEVS
jgi:O-antigen/teichoic acid export membrane protein